MLTAQPGVVLMIEVGYKMRFFMKDAEIAARELGVVAWKDRHWMVSWVQLDVRARARHSGQPRYDLLLFCADTTDGDGADVGPRPSAHQAPPHRRLQGPARHFGSG